MRRSSPALLTPQPENGFAGCRPNTNAPLRSRPSRIARAAGTSGMRCSRLFLVRRGGSTIRSPTTSHQASPPISSRRQPVKTNNCDDCGIIVLSECSPNRSQFAAIQHTRTCLLWRAMSAGNRITVAQSLPHRPSEKRRQRGAHTIGCRCAAIAGDTRHCGGNRATVDLC